jgi:hypothetical protein
MTIVGQYGDEVQLDSAGVPLRTTAITVKSTAGVVVTLYDDLTGMSSTVGNPVNTDDDGNLILFAPPAQYQLWAGGVQYATINIDLAVGMVGVAGGLPGPLGLDGLLPAAQTRPVVAGIDIINPLATPYSAVGNGIADDTVPLQNALAALHISGGKLYLPSRSGFKTTGTLSVTKETVDIVGPGSAKATLLPAFNGDCIRVQMASFVADRQAGELSGFTIDLTGAGASAVGIHYGDAMNGRLSDLHVVNGVGGSNIGVSMDNVTNYTEGTAWDRVLISNCKTCLRFNRSGSANNSFAYQVMNKVRLTCNSGQVGVKLINGALVYNGFIGISGNFAAGSTFMQIDGQTGGTPGVTAMADCIFAVQVEVTGGGTANGVQLSEFGGISGSGIFDLSSGTFVCSNDYTATSHPGAAALSGGRIVTPGLIGTTMLGTAITGAAHASSSGFFLPVVSNGATFYLDLRT